MQVRGRDNTRRLGAGLTPPGLAACATCRVPPVPPPLPPPRLASIPLRFGWSPNTTLIYSTKKSPSWTSCSSQTQQARPAVLLPDYTTNGYNLLSVIYVCLVLSIYRPTSMIPVNETFLPAKSIALAVLSPTRRTSASKWLLLFVLFEANPILYTVYYNKHGPSSEIIPSSTTTPALHLPAMTS